MTPSRLTVEVFPVAKGRWIAVIDGPEGAFSTEAAEPGSVADEVQRAVGEVLGHSAPPVRLVDENGADWDLQVAQRQAQALDL